MGQFIKCFEGDLSGLIVDGKPTELQLANAWETLFLQYCDKVEAREVTYRIRLKSEVSLLTKKVEFGKIWVKLLSIIHSPELIKALKVIGFDDFELNPEEPQQFKADLMRIKAELSMLSFTLKVKSAELQAIEEDSHSGDKADRAYFAKIFFKINNYAKREAVNMMTTVEDYCVALRDFVDYYEQLKLSHAR